MVKRYDCGNGGAQFCQGCYQMEEDELGDYVTYEDYEALKVAAQAVIYEDGDFVSNSMRRALDALSKALEQGE